jgi:hypothetical protein
MILLQMGGPPDWGDIGNGNPPPPPPNFPGTCIECVPIDQGALLLILVAIIVGVYYLKSKKYV